MDNSTPIQFEKKKSNAGRHRKEFKKEYCAMLVQHMSQGLSVESFAGVVSIGKTTLYEWLKLYPEFANAAEEGRGKSQLLWEKMGTTGAMGKLKGFNSDAWKFNMQNRFKWKMREDVTTDDEKIEIPQIILDTRPKET